jgi:hypothetical protein
MEFGNRVLLKRRKFIGVVKGCKAMWFLVMNSGEMKQSDAPESMRTRTRDFSVWRWRMNESLFGIAARVAVYGIGQLLSCNEYIEELPTSFPRLQ